MTRSTVSKACARIVRIVTVPPVMVAALLLTLYYAAAVFTGIPSLLLALLFLAVIPVLAYPVTALIPPLRKNRRENERNLAFVFTAVGYVGGIIYALCCGAARGLLLVFLTYFLSALLLVLCNKILHRRASGHACSIFGPILLLLCLTGWRFILPCLVIFAAVIWSSLRLGRHTPQELLLGSLCAAAGFLLGLPVLV